MKILVTGSSGFIGQHLVRHLASLGHEVCGTDLREPVGNSSFRFIRGDLLSGGDLAHVFGQFSPEGVIHLAAETGLDESRGISGYSANIDGVRNLIQAINKQGGVRRAVFTSTQLVCRIGYQPTGDEDYAPDTLYGQSKVQTEKIVREFDGAGSVWCIGRPTTIWGPGMNPHYQRFFRMIKQGRYFHTGNRRLMKSYGYVGNIAHQYERMLMCAPQLVHRKVFYLADYSPLSLREWADAFAHELGAPRIRSYPEWLVGCAAKAGDLVTALGYRSFPFNSFRLKNILTEYVYDMKRTEQVCGSIPFEMLDGVRETVKWIRSLNL